MVEPPLFLPLAARCFGLMAQSVPPRGRRSRSSSAWRSGSRAPAPGSSAISRSFRRATGLALLRHSYALIIGLWQMSAATRDGEPRCPMVAVTIRRRSSAGVTPTSSTARCAPCGTARVAGGRERGQCRLSGATRAIANLRVAGCVACAVRAAPREAGDPAVRCSPVQVEAPRRRRRQRAVRRRSEAASRSRPRLSHRRQDRRALRRCRRAREARARRSRGSIPPTSDCRPKPRRPQVAATETEYQFAQAEYQRYQNLHAREIHQRLGARREAQHAGRQPRQIRAGEGAISPCRRTRRATRRSSRTKTASSPRSTRSRGRSSRRGSRSCGSRARTSARSRSACPKTASAKSRARSSSSVVAVGEPGKTSIAARVREISPAVDAVTRTFAVRVTIVDADAVGAMGDDGERRRARRTAARRPRCCRSRRSTSTTASPRCGASTLRRSRWRSRRWRSASTARTASSSPSGVSNGDWIVAAGVHKLSRARSCGLRRTGTDVPTRGAQPLTRPSAHVAGCPAS